MMPFEPGGIETKGYADEVEIERVKEWEQALLRFMATSNPEIVKTIAKEKALTEETEKKLAAAIESFNSTWS